MFQIKESLIFCLEGTCLVCVIFSSQFRNWVSREQFLCVQ